MFNVALHLERSLGYSRRALAGTIDYAKTHGPWRFHGQPRHLVPPIPDLASWRGDGAIAMVATSELLAQFRAASYPVVNISGIFGDTGLPTVTIDNRAAGRLAAEHFIQRGFHRLAFFSFSQAHYAMLRREGFDQTLEDHRHRRVEPDVDRPAGNWEAGHQYALRWLGLLPRPAGVFCGNDEAAAQLILAAQELGLRVPEDVAVLGVDNDELVCEVTDPPVSSIDVDAYRIGYEAARLLDRLMRGEPPPAGPVMIPPRRIVERRSTDIVMVGDPVLARALAIIREQATSGLNVEDLLDVLGVSRRSLELKFNAALQRSPAVEIRRVQIDRARALLSDTDAPIGEVAQRSGLHDARQMAIAFRKALGVSPSAYRRQFRG